MRDNSSYKKNIQAKPMALRSISAGDVLAASSSEFTLKQSAIHMAVLLLTGCLANNSALAEPTGGVVKSGTAQIDKTGSAGQSTTTVNQISNSLSLEWQSFNLGKTETVNFMQPTTNSVAINRILSASGTDIQGKINANGKVWLINPNGVFFGKDAQVNVGGLVATTLDNLSNTTDSQNFQGDSKATVENLGNIVTTSGGSVLLLGHAVKNSGTINADGGIAALAAGSDITLQFQNNNRISVVVSQNQLNALASNEGVMQANGGQVLLNAGASNSLLAAAVNNAGVLQARTTVLQNGKIALSAEGKNSKLNLAGSLDASADGNLSGGSIETMASIVEVDGTTKVNTKSMSGIWGNWRVTQNNSAQLPADANLSSIFKGNVLNDSLNYTNVTLATKKDITVDARVVWDADSKLTLSADRNIKINAPITANGSQASLALAYGQGSRNGSIGGGGTDYDINAKVNLKEGRNFSTQLGSAGTRQDYYVITKLGESGSTTGQDLQGMNGNLLRNYALGSDIDATATANWDAFPGGSGFNPVGGVDRTNSFRGTFAGLGHTVDGLSIKAPNSDVIGLFGYVYKGALRDIGLTNLSVSGKNLTGGLTGILDTGNVKNSYTSGVVTGEADLGGLVGMALKVKISDSHSSANVTGTEDQGGVGGLAGSLDTVTIINSYSSGKIKGALGVGGLAGWASFSTIDQSYSLSSISSDSGIAGAGGLVGRMQYTTIRSSFADTQISGNMDAAGGLVGQSLTNNTVSNSYAVGRVEGAKFEGGLIGRAWTKNFIGNSFASVDLLGTMAKGGLVAFVFGDTKIVNSYWDSSKFPYGYTLFGGASTTNSNGLTTDQLKQKSSFASFDMANEWTIYEGHTMPLLQSFMTPLTLKMNASQGQTYNASVQYNGTASIENQDDVRKLLGTPNYVLTGKNAGTQAVVDNGLYSSQLGYLINFDTSGSQVQIAKASVDISGITADNKVYDGNQAASMNRSQMLTSGIYAADQGSVSLDIRGTFDTKDVGDNKQVSIAGQTGGASGANYIITGQTSTTANITPATYTALNGSKTYDGTNQFSNVTLTGVNGESFAVANAASNGVNVSNHPQNAATTFVQADGVSEVAGSLGRISNYKPLDITQLTNKQAVITPADFQAIAGIKIYDGSTTFQQVLVSGVNNEVFTVKADANSKNTSSNSINPAKTFTSVDGTPDPVTGSGADLRNYNSLNLETVKNNQAVITPKPLLVNGVTANDKIYDGTRDVVLDTSQALTNTSGVVAGDDVSLKNITGQFIDKNVANGKRVDLSQIEFIGNSKENYTAATQQFTTANISPKALTVSGLKAQDKVYDGNQTAQVDTSKPFAADSGLVKNDDVQVSSVTGTFSDKNAAPDKTVALSNAVYAGADKNNYLIIDQKNSFASINQAEFTEAVGNKAYDGSTEVRHVSVTGVNGEFFEAEGKANSKNASRSPVDPGNLLVQINQVQSQRFDINNYKPLDVNVLQKNIVVIEPGLLKYVADKVTLYVSDPVEGLTGTVTGFLQKDNLENSTTGDLSWISSATTESPEGEYQITGQGLASDNYDFVQHEDNPIALSLIPSPFNRVVVTTRPLMVEPEDVTDENPNNTKVVKKTVKPVVIPTINDLQTNHPVKINSLPSRDAQAMNAATRLSSLEDDYWFLDCFFSSSQEFKKIKCEPGSQKKLPSIEIKKYPNKKITALNSPLLP